MKWLNYLDKIIQPKAEHCNDKIHEKQIVLYSVHLYQQVNTANMNYTSKHQ